MRKPDVRTAPALCSALLVTAALAAHSAAPMRQAPDTFTLPAAQSAYIRASGPVTGDTAERYLDVEGKDTGRYACYGVLRFDAGTLKTGLENKFGAGQFKISGLTLRLTQHNAKFTHNGSVALYLSTDAETKFSALKYPYDPKSVTMHGETLATLKFSQSAATAPDATSAKGKADDSNNGQKAIEATTDDPASAAKSGDGKPTAAPTDKFESYALAKATGSAALVRALTEGKSFTLVLVEGDPTVAATWAGAKASGARLVPTLVVKAEPK